VSSQQPPKIYLAGPGVFRPDAIAYGALLRAKCEQRGLRGLYPLDNTIKADTPEAAAAEIFKGNVGMIDDARGIVADISPFRGPNMDPGTAWEIGYGIARGLPVFAWSSDTSTLLQRTQRYFKSDNTVDPDGLMIEDFGGVENLMCGFRRSRPGITG
jgi:nucleoside 2-deoxyribosyltransferase